MFTKTQQKILRECLNYGIQRQERLLRHILKDEPKTPDEVKGFYEPEQDDVYNYWNFRDGTWRRRGFSSCYGVFTKKATLKY